MTTTKTPVPLRAVIETREEGKDLVDVLACGHKWYWLRGDPKTGWGGSNAAKRRRCNAC